MTRKILEHWRRILENKRKYFDFDLKREISRIYAFT
jgi:hypothetical protein